MTQCSSSFLLATAILVVATRTGLPVAAKAPFAESPGAPAFEPMEQPFYSPTAKGGGGDDDDDNKPSSFSPPASSPTGDDDDDDDDGKGGKGSKGDDDDDDFIPPGIMSRQRR